MAVKIIKHRLFTWFEEVDSLVVPGTRVLSERINHMGDEVDITNPVYVQRGEQPDIDAFYTDEEADAIRNGTYDGADREVLATFRQNLRPIASVQSAGELGAGPAVDASTMDAADLGEFIKANRLTIPQTVALAGDDEDSINKVLDAENIATNNTPRKGVIDELEKRLSAGTPVD